MKCCFEEDIEIAELILKETARQNSVLRLIPSENYISDEVADALASSFGNKYSEGYVGKRYYQGTKNIDELESLVITRAKTLFNVPHVNVQPYSGSIANASVYFSLLDVGDSLMGMELSSGGHLTHGFPKITFSGKYFKSFSYPVGKDGFIDYDLVRDLAVQHRPKMIISGASSYPRSIDFSKFGEIADEVSAYHVADISHIAGLVATGLHQSPVEYADVVTTTTHKTLRGPRGAMIMVTKKGLDKDSDLANKIDKGVFPGMQGGPHDNTIAGIGVCLGEALKPEFSDYISQVVKNAARLAEELQKAGFDLITGGTDNHLILVDIRGKGLDGWLFAWALEYAGIIVNRNAIPYDPNPPFYPSGVRLGTPAVTSLGLKETDMVKIAGWMKEVAEIAQTVGIKERREARSAFSTDSRLGQISAAVEKFVSSFVNIGRFVGKGASRRVD